MYILNNSNFKRLSFVRMIITVIFKASEVHTKFFSLKLSYLNTKLKFKVSDFSYHTVDRRGFGFKNGDLGGWNLEIVLKNCDSLEIKKLDRLVKKGRNYLCTKSPFYFVKKDTENEYVLPYDLKCDCENNKITFIYDRNSFKHQEDKKIEEFIENWKKILDDKLEKKKFKGAPCFVVKYKKTK